MTIEQLEETKAQYVNECVVNNLGEDGVAVIGVFMEETIATFKTQSDMIADLRQQLEKKMKEVEQKESYFPRSEIKIGLTDPN